MEKKNDDKQKGRKDQVEEAKEEMAQLILFGEAFKAEVPEVAKFLEVFKVEDIGPAMPGRHWEHERIAFTKKIIANILNHIVNYGIIVDACVSSGVSYRNWEQLCKQFPDLNALKDEAKELYREKISRAVHNRAIEGWLEPVFYKGGLVGYIRRFSDRMLELQAKRHIPEYRDKSAVDMNVAGGVLVVNSGDIQDKEAWLEEQRKRKQIISQVVE